MVNIYNWCADICDLEYIYDNFMWCNIELAAKRFQILGKKQWKEKALSRPKWRVYKEQRGEEQYVLTGMSRRERSLLAQFRFGILPLEIEV